jgi:hypothetical protein
VPGAKAFTSIEEGRYFSQVPSGYKTGLSNLHNVNQSYDARAVHQNASDLPCLLVVHLGTSVFLLIFPAPKLTKSGIPNAVHPYGHA